MGCDKQGAIDSNQSVDVFKLIDDSILSNPLTKEELRGFGVRENPKPVVNPFFKTIDLNNQNEQDVLRCTPPKSAWCIGLKWSF